jgi:hypothetical protein
MMLATSTIREHIETLPIYTIRRICEEHKIEYNGATIMLAGRVITDEDLDVPLYMLGVMKDDDPILNVAFKAKCIEPQIAENRKPKYCALFQAIYRKIIKSAQIKLN